MALCNRILVPVIATIRMWIRTVTEIVRTVCETVVRTVRRVKEVCEKACGWLGPFSFVCDWVCELVEVVEEVTEWVCREVVERIVRWIEIVFEYVFYVVKWVCWAIDWIIYRWWAMILCAIGVRRRKVIRVCVRILNDPEEGPAATIEEVNDMMAEADEILEQCDIDVVIDNVGFVDLPEFMTTTRCDFGGMFSDFWVRFNELACSSRTGDRTVTVYVVEDIQGAGGCAYPGTDWVIVEGDSSGATVVQEIGHLADIWPHSDDPDNVMSNEPGGSRDQLTRGQCCLIRTSRFTTSVRSDEVVREAISAERESLGRPIRTEREG